MNSCSCFSVLADVGLFVLYTVANINSERSIKIIFVRVALSQRLIYVPYYVPYLLTYMLSEGLILRDFVYDIFDPIDPTIRENINSVVR